MVSSFTAWLAGASPAFLSTCAGTHFVAPRNFRGNLLDAERRE